MIGASVTDYVKTAFHIYSYRAGDNRPWEHLSDREQQAWDEAISSVQDALEEEHNRVPCCPACDAEMACPKCDADDDDGENAG